jgi:hypothetical protein
MANHDVRRIHIRSTAAGPCPVCDEMVRDRPPDSFDSEVNHLLGHDWILLHVGQETVLGVEDLQTQTVAVLGEPRI